MNGRKRVGSWVRLKVGQRERKGPQKARIVEERPKIARGAVFLSAPLAGFRWWNKADLELTTPPRTGRCAFCGRSTSAPNFAYHVCAGRQL